MPTPPVDPLVLDLDGDGIELISVGASSTHFDFDGDGFSERVGWVAPDDGFLVLDRDASGSINSASELFGNELVDGYTKLRELDTNQDGVINSADEQFAQLQIWRDLNGNGTSEAGELVSLSSLGIVTIGLERTPHGRPIAGNEVAFTGSFARGDGSVGATGAVFFQADRTLTRWNPPEGFVLDPDTAVLPLLKGYGTLPDLNYAMTLDSNLKQMVQEFTLGVGSMDRAQMSSAFMALMYRWAGVEGVAPGSRGPNVDAVHLAFLDKFFGSPIVRPASNGSPGIPNARFGQEIESSFAEVFGALLVRFLSSVPISMLQLGADWDNLLDLPFLSLRHLKYEAGSDGFQGQAKFVIFEALHNIPAQPQAAIDYIDEVIFILSGLTLEFYSGDRARFVEDVRLNLLDLTDKGLATLAVDLASNGSALTKGTVAGEAIVGTTKADIIIGFQGNDTLTGGGGADTYVYARGDGHDVIIDAASYNNEVDKLVLTGVDPGAVTLQRNGNDLTLVIAESEPGAGDGGSILIKATLDDYYSSGLEQIVLADGTVWTKADLRLMLLAQASTAGDDTIAGFDVADVITAGAGNDTVNAGAGNDSITGGLGNDTLTGGGGADTYVYARGDGHDVIVETGFLEGVADTLVLTGVASTAVTVERFGSDVTLVIAESAPGAGDGGRIKLKEQYQSLYDRGVETVTFSDGVSWTKADIANIIAEQIGSSGVTHPGTTGDDTISGTSGNDTFDGYGGNDTLTGGVGSDTYRFGVGSGNDLIIETSSAADTDRIELLGLNPDDVVLSRSGNHLFVVIKATGETLKVQDHFYVASYGIDQIVFANGTTLDRAAIQQAAWIRGDGGDNALTGSAANDTLDGGAGNDTLTGGTGSDTYRFGVGSGNDVIIETSSAADTDRINLLGLNPDDVVLNRSGNHLFVTIKATGETLKVQDHFYTTSYGIDQIVFANGTTLDRVAIQQAAWIRGDGGDNSLTGSAANDTLDGGAGNDTLNGGTGSDTYRFGAGSGNDVVIETSSAADTDRIELLGLNPDDVVLSRSGNHLFVVIKATGETLKVQDHFYTTSYGIDQIVFANGTSLDRAAIQQAAWIRGDAGDNTLTGTSGNDVFEGGGGNDRFNSGAGNDTYIYRSGDGSDVINEESGSTTEVDVLKFANLNASDLTLARAGQHLVVTVNSTGQTITVDEHFYSQTANWGVERFEFADGTSWNLSEINSRAWFKGTVGNDTLSGSSWNDTFHGGMGDDRFNSAVGSDTFLYASGDGNDVINEESGSTSEIDVLKFTDLNASDLTLARLGQHLVVTVNSTGQTITIDEHFYSQTANYGVERFEFADGTGWNFAEINARAWYRGTAGNDTISGSAWNDTLSGGAGNDTFSGGAGSDVFVFAPGFGKDTITDFVAGSATADLIEFDDAVFADLNAVLAAATQVGADTVITFDADNTITLKNVTKTNLHADDFRFV
ncbi:calcium-binding protein [Bosea sp. Tri-54]|uniref:beta strand repeat-containing protein n=1 Tax=Bosea sp. Tri-54 TaxID=1867716 RepID=UPI001011B12A|nr:calcium-binding protein [Bosea sp. Tri-54]